MGDSKTVLNELLHASQDLDCRRNHLVNSWGVLQYIHVEGVLLCELISLQFMPVGTIFHDALVDL